MATSAKKKAAERARAEAEAKLAESVPTPVLPQCNCLASFRRRTLHAIGCPLMGIVD